MKKMILFTLAAALIACGFVRGIREDGAGSDGTEQALPREAQSVSASDGKDETRTTEPESAASAISGETASLREELSSVRVNGRRLPLSAVLDTEGAEPELWISVPGFCAFVLPEPENGEEREDPVTAVPGECFLRCGERRVPCSLEGPGTAVLERDGEGYAPASALARAAGMEYGKTADGAVLRGVPLFPGPEALYSDEDLYWLSRIISAEARGEPFEGQIAVGTVVLNRVDSPLFPSSVYDVVFDDRFGIQFTPAYSGSVYRDPTESSVLAARLCLEGMSLSDAILFFFNSSLASGSWITSNRTYAMTVGGHDFYS